MIREKEIFFIGQTGINEMLRSKHYTRLETASPIFVDFSKY